MPLKAVATSDRFQKLCRDIKKHEEEVHNYERLALQKSATDHYLALRTFIGAYDDHLRRTHDFHLRAFGLLC